MSALTTPKGPLPARVYWFRRLVLLSAAFLLVLTGAKLLGGSSDGRSDADERATTAAAETTTSPTAGASVTGGAPAASVAPPEAATDEGSTRKERRAAKKAAAAAATPTPAPLPTPSGPCTGEDLVVVPAVGEVRAGGQVEFALNFRSLATPACTWQVSPETVTVKITSGDDDIWFSQECPASLPVQDIVVYQGQDTAVPMVWNGKRSDEECSRLTDWARPGFYHLVAATYGGEPTDVQFELRVAAPVTVTKTVQPEEPKDKKPKKERRGDRPGGEPSGAVEPNG